MIPLLVLAMALLVAPVAEARRYEVNVRGDHRPGACTLGDCTLREAVIAANARQGRDTIALPSRRRYKLARRSTGEDRAANGDLDITSGPLRIVHPGKGRATIDANRTDRIFDVGSAVARFEKLVIRGGRAHPVDADGDGGGITAGDLGDARLTIVDSAIVDNRAPAVDGNGGGLDTDSPSLVRVVRTTVKRNVAGGEAGGIAGSIAGPALIEDSTIVGNRSGEGGGVMAVGPVTIVGTTIASNRVVGGGDGELGDGGGVYVDDQGLLAVTNSTITENFAIRSGGGIYGETGGRATIQSATIARNRADSDDRFGGDGGGILLASATFDVSNSILALNTFTAGAQSDCAGATFTGTAPNLITTADGGCGPGTELVADPLIGRLGRNGGPTRTLALAEGSPAIGAADPASSPSDDQRGAERDGDPDLGAFERVPVAR